MQISSILFESLVKVAKIMQKHFEMSKNAYEDMI